MKKISWSIQCRFIEAGYRENAGMKTQARSERKRMSAMYAMFGLAAFTLILWATMVWVAFTDEAPGP